MTHTGPVVTPTSQPSNAVRRKLYGKSTVAPSLAGPTISTPTSASGTVARRTYGRYINSRAWANRRKQYFERYARQCAFCGKRTEIELHHHTYERMGRELDDDMVPLCRDHHQAVHDYHNAHGGTLTAATRAVASLLGVEVQIVKRRPRGEPTRKERDKARRQRKQERITAARRARAQ